MMALRQRRYLAQIPDSHSQGRHTAMSENPNPEDTSGGQAWAGPAMFALFIFLSLGLAYQVAHSFKRHFIAFYPGLYAHVPMRSGEEVSAAMRAVHAASDPKALDTAVANMKAMIEAGDSEAAFRLGRYYHLESAEPDYALALKYYQIAVDDRHAWAINNVGLLYRDGLGVQQNEEKAYQYFQRAAREHSQWAYVNLADMTLGGRRFGGDTHGGMDWLEQGAADDCTLCLVEEAAAYHSGTHGVRRDTDKAIALLNKAAALGDPQASLILAEMELVGDGLAQNPTDASKRLQSLSDQGFGNASNLLGELAADDKIRDYLFTHYLGGVEQIPETLKAAFAQRPVDAIKYWELAEQQGNCQSLIDLSSVFDRGIGVDANPQQAANYVTQAVHCEPDNSFYVWKLAMRFYDAKGRDQDCQYAEKLFRQSLDLGYADAAVNLGYIYDKGCGSIARDDDRAFQIYLLGAKLGVALCQNNVGAMLKHGRGVPNEDLARGYGWQQLAALRGDELAKKNLQDPRFTPEIRVMGLANAADIQARLLRTPSNHQSIKEDPWY